MTVCYLHVNTRVLPCLSNFLFRSKDYSMVQVKQYKYKGVNIISFCDKLFVVIVIVLPGDFSWLEHTVLAI